MEAKVAPRDRERQRRLEEGDVRVLRDVDSLGHVLAVGDCQNKGIERRSFECEDEELIRESE
jgi:hypothetical protein